MSTVNYSAERLQAEQAERGTVRAVLSALAKRHSWRGLTIVELGSGLGTNLELLAGDNEVLGLEGLPQAVEQANARGVTTVQANLDDALALASQSCDVVLCLDVLEHLQTPEHCLAEAHRVLKSAGVLVVNVPNHFCLAGRLRILGGSGADSLRLFPGHEDWNNPHLRFFRRASIESLLKHAGFRVVEDCSRHFPAIPLLWRWPAVGASKSARAFAAWAPDLYAGGFFLVARKAQ